MRKQGARDAFEEPLRIVESVTGATEVRLELIGSSNGCRSFAVHVGDRAVKCYECLTSARARLVHRLSNALRHDGIAMPECFGVGGNLVVAEWLDGSSLESLGETEKIDLMAAYQARIHGAGLPSLPKRRESMPHMRWLFERVRRFGRGIVDDDVLARLRDRVLRSRPEGAPWGVLHPDLIATNLVVTRNGVACIDNEFLCVGYGQEWDILNTVKVSFPDQLRLQDRYLAAYSRHRSVHTLASHREFWEATYDIKMAGKCLTEGRAEEGLGCLRSAAAKL